MAGAGTFSTDSRFALGSFNIQRAYCLIVCEGYNMVNYQKCRSNWHYGAIVPIITSIGTIVPYCLFDLKLVIFYCNYSVIVAV